jgi:2',3'-cyclic-nucleotide 2'-phosphodiesterase/3'-nucleotidase
MEGTTVLFDTGPAASNYIGDVTSVSIEDTGENLDGFSRYRIAL